jgi:hypothetical protein
MEEINLMQNSTHGSKLKTKYEELLLIIAFLIAFNHLIKI